MNSFFKTLCIKTHRTFLTINKDIEITSNVSLRQRVYSPALRSHIWANMRQQSNLFVLLQHFPRYVASRTWRVPVESLSS